MAANYALGTSLKIRLVANNSIIVLNKALEATSNGFDRTLL